MSMKLIYKDVAVGADSDAAVTTSDAQSFCTPTRLPFGESVPPIATFEKDMWALDGSFVIRDGQTIPFWSKAISSADGVFSTPPAMTIAFDKQYTSLGIYLRFAPNTGDYCTAVTITWFRGTSQLAQKTFAPTSASYFCANTVTAYDKVIISFGATNKPYRFVHLEQVLFGVFREFHADELSEIKILQETNLISAELAINTLNWKLYSTENVEYIFQLKQPVEAYNNDNLVGVFYLTGSKRTAAQIYEVACQDAIGVLDGYPFTAAIYSAYNAVTLIRNIVGSDFDLEIDNSFSAATVTGFIPGCTKREALQQVLFAIGAACDTSGDRTIRIFAVPASGSEIADDRIYSGGSVDTDAIVTAIMVTAHTYTAGNGVNGDDVVEVGGTKYVHTTAVTTITNPTVTATDKQNIIKIEEATLVSPANVAAVAQRVYDYYTRRNTLNMKIVAEAEKPGDFVSLTTPWDTEMKGSITSMSIVLSNTTAADIKVKAVNP